MGLARSSARYQAREGRADQDQIQQSLHQFAQNPRKRRRGYRLVHAELKRKLAKEGKALNHIRDAFGVGSASGGSGEKRVYASRRADARRSCAPVNRQRLW